MVHFLIPPSIKGRNPDRIFGCNYGLFTQHNIFLLSAATVLKEAGFKVEVIDCIKEKLSLKEVLKKKADVYVFYSVFLSREIDWEAAEAIERKQNAAIVFLGPEDRKSVV